MIASLIRTVYFLRLKAENTAVTLALRVNIKIEGVLYPENAREKMTPCPHKIIIITTII